MHLFNLILIAQEALSLSHPMMSSPVLLTRSFSGIDRCCNMTMVFYTYVM